MTYLLYYPIFWAGYLLFKITGKTAWYPFVSFRRLFVFTKGKSNDAISRRLTKSERPYPINHVDGVLGDLSKTDIKAIGDSIRENGYYIFSTKLSAEKVEDLTQFALTIEADLVPAPKEGPSRAFYSRNKVVTSTYWFTEDNTLKFPLIQELLADPSMFAVAQDYLECKPIQDLTAMWWSTAFAKEASSQAAQLFHFDMDRFKFIKFFFYLTDVGPDNGPHCFISGTHKNLPDNLWKDGRIPDAEIFSSFAPKDILEITGPKGTIIAVDTRGLHKGKVLRSGERLLFQIEFTNSLFGATYNEIDLSKNIIPQARTFFEKYRYAYQRFKF
jgi:hypothetical protein